MSKAEQAQRLAQARASYDAAVDQLTRDDRQNVKAQKRAMELAKRQGTWNPTRIDPLTDALMDVQAVFTTYYVRRLISALEAYLQALDTFHDGAMMHYFKPAMGATVKVLEATQTHSTLGCEAQDVSTITRELIDAHVWLAAKTYREAPPRTAARHAAKKQLLAAWAAGQALGCSEPTMAEVAEVLAE